MNKNELIAVVAKEKIFFNTKHENGFFEYSDLIIENIKSYSINYIRDLAEINYDYKQIVSYIIFYNNKNIFLMERSNNASEEKLNNKLSIGIGGHLTLLDLNKSYLDWGMREFYEEVDYYDNFNIKLIGIINDESNNVGKLHLGIVYLMSGDSDQIKINSELKSGKLISIAECLSYYDKLESWSQIMIKFLNNQKSLFEN